MKILIATPTYPPDHGGPAYYAKSLKDEFERLGHTVAVRKYDVERRFPSWIKHLVYFLKTVPAYVKADYVILLDPMIVGFPVAMLKVFFGGTVILRTGGDFLWEQYVERTKYKILLSNFYNEPRRFTMKEKIIFRLTRFVLHTVSYVAFSTPYQRDIWVKAYRIHPEHVTIIENRFEPPQEMRMSVGKTFVYAAARELVWKNAGLVKEGFAIAQKNVPDAGLEFLFDVSREEAMEKIKNAYAVILTSLGDISPNYILRAISFGVPVILTRETGLRPRIGDAALYVDPLDKEAIAKAVVAMSDPAIHDEYRRRIATLSFTHTYADIAKEFLALHS